MSEQELEENRDLVVNNRSMPHNHVVPADLEEGSIEGCLDVEDDVTNACGTVHGGALYTLTDVITGMTTRGSGHAYMTQTMDLHYLMSATEKCIYGRSYVLHRGSKTAVVAVKVTDSKGKKLFLATFTLYCVDGRVAVKRRGNKHADS